LRGVLDLSAVVLELLLRLGGDGHEACEAHSRMAVGELLLPLGGGLGDASPPRRLDEALPPAQLLVGDVARPCCLYLADRTQRRDRLERDRDRAHSLRMQEQGRQERGTYLDTRPASNPVGCVYGAIAS